MRDVRPAPFPLTFEKVTAPVTFRVVMFASGAVIDAVLRVTRFASGAVIDAVLRVTKLASGAVRFEIVPRLVTFSVVRFAPPKRFEALRDVRPAPFPLTFEKVTAPVTFRVVMLAVVARIFGV